MNKDWNGALPATLIYDKKGQQQAFFIGKKDFNAFRQEIEKVNQNLPPAARGALFEKT